MKKQLQKKHKVMLGVGSGILAATAVATPLAITLTRKETINPNNMDEKYGVDAASYDNMKKDLDNDYFAKLQQEKWSKEVITKKMTQMHESIRNIDNCINNTAATGTKSNLYTAATKMLRNYATHELGIDLVRKSRANWNEVENMYNGMKSSFITYMNAHFFDEDKQQEVLARAQTSYNNILSQVRTQYANDILSGVMKAKNQLISCFDTINTEIARLAAFMRLNEFVTNYTFEFREDALSTYGSNNANRLDTLLKEGALVDNQTISQENMNKIFVCYNSETRQEVSFDTNMLPGYKLTPIFKGYKSNGEKNDHSILIDWTCISANYDNSNDAEAATAHLVDPDDQLYQDIKQTNKIKSIDNIFDLFNKSVKLTSYNLLASPEYEVNQLSATYFNSQSVGHNIKLLWHNDDACYDGFMYAEQASTKEQTLTFRELAQTNIYISDGINEVLLKDVFKTVDQENYEPNSLIEKFVKYCDVSDTIKLSKGTGDRTNVTNTFTAFYKNQKNWKDSYQSAQGLYQFAEGVPANNYTISEQFFCCVNTAYNSARTNTNTLINKEYQNLVKHAKSTDDTFMWSGIIAGIIAAVWIGSALLDLFEQSYARAGAMFLAGSVGGAVAGISVFLQSRFRKKFVNKATRYGDKADEFSGGTYVDIVKNKLKKDEHHFALVNEEGKIDKDDYEQKLQEFKELGTKTQKQLFLTYRDFATGFAEEFFKKAYELQINPEKFEQDFDGWREKTNTEVDFFIATITIGMVAMTLLRSWAADLPLLPPEKADVEESADEIQEDEDGELGRVIDTRVKTDTVVLDQEPPVRWIYGG